MANLEDIFLRTQLLHTHVSTGLENFCAIELSRGKLAIEVFERYSLVMIKATISFLFLVFWPSNGYAHVEEDHSGHGRSLRNQTRLETVV